MYSQNRSPKAEKKRNDIYEQKREAGRIIRANEYKDQINKEEVNLLTPQEISSKLEVVFKGVLIAAIPDIDRGHVLEVPNVYHLELFPFCNEVSFREVTVNGFDEEDY